MVLSHHSYFNPRAVQSSSLTPVNVSQASIKRLSALGLVNNFIFIDGNANFSATAAAKNWPGDGTKATPFIIDGLTIVGLENSSVIEIRNTNVSFNLLNCVIKGGLYGIYLDNVVNGTISNNTLINNTDNGIYLVNSRNNTLSHNILTNNGVRLRDSEKNYIINNYVINNDKDGISLENSGRCTLLNNTISYNRWNGILIDGSRRCSVSANFLHNNQKNGILINNSKNNILSNNIISNNLHTGISVYRSGICTVYNNTVSNNSLSGIVLTGSGDGILSGNKVSNNIDGIGLDKYSRRYFLSDNIIFNNSGNGIYMKQSTRCTLFENTVFNNQRNGIRMLWKSGDHSLSRNNISYNHRHGIKFEDSGGCTLLRNTFSFNGKYGVYIRSSSAYNTLKFNDFIRNYQGEEAQAFDEGQYCDFAYNYWDEWISPDTNTDKIVDIPYTIPYTITGESKNQDSHPLTASVYEIHILTEPTILYPHPGDNLILSGTVPFEWTSSMCSFEHSITYSVLYSINNGTFWILLDSNLTKSDYYGWDTTLVVDGSNYMIKVVAECVEGITAEDTFDGTFTIKNISTPTTLSSLINLPGIALLLIFISLIIYLIKTQKKI